MYHNISYAAFNTMTDVASSPPQSSRFRRDRPTLERRVGKWLRDFKQEVSQPDFKLSSYLVKFDDN